MASQQLYHPIKSYQTRLLCLDGDNGLPGSQVSCSLHTADLLHPNAEGLLVRSIAGATESLIEYDALSYAWGSGGKIKKIRCNGLQVLVTKNLFEALSALRHPEQRYLWVDALCINQDDSSEKNEQVWNMLAIYQKARKVIAWLGAAEKNLDLVLNPPSSTSKTTFDFSGAVQALSFLYTRPWFNRLWVQQEIFAARKMEFQCGKHRFEWSQLLSQPKLLLSLTYLKSYDQLEERRKKGDRNTTTELPKEIVDQMDAVSELDERRMQDLKCFEIFSGMKEDRPFLVDALLNTGLLNATNPRDHIYGIIGMTGHPAKPMRMQEWLTARQSEVFIPIDYSVDLTSIACAVTWVLIMKDGLDVLAKFKFFSAAHQDTYGQSLPSWVVDWRLAAEECVPNKFRTKLWRDKIGKVDPLAQLGKDNKDPNAMIPCNKLILRGTPDSRFYTKRDSVWEKRLIRPDTVAWRLNFDTHTTDLILRMHAFLNPNSESSSGLWLLRPVENNEFKLMACLQWAPWRSHSLYEQWEWRHSRYSFNFRGGSKDESSRLAVDSEGERYWPKNSGRANEFAALIDEDHNSANTRAFTIV